MENANEVIEQERRRLVNDFAILEQRDRQALDYHRERMRFELRHREQQLVYQNQLSQPHIHRLMRTNENMLHNPRIDNNNNQQTLQIYPNNDYFASSKIDRKNLKHLSGKTVKILNHGYSY